MTIKKELYKLTDENMQTRNGYQWSLGDWHETSGEGDLCGPGWLHGYEHSLLAVLHNPIDADIQQPRLFECEWSGEIKRNGQMKCGVTRLRLVQERELPEITVEQKIAYGIYCAKEVYADKEWNAWADAWLSGNDRSLDTAAAAADDAADDAADAAAWAAARASWAAARADADADINAAAAASWAAARASTERDINLVECAEKAMLIGEGI